ncbi:hypothetical protein E8E13_001216 [Curvularia kusanoi]|uniref:Uncharacterized protein n=1 Tax=Curvularia kusanoi TaxID=90978 RepID=A0A9P4W6P7_CURKU|nr:hypothetical protein E8E13_001216 [Curvularia kusanoi]
MFSFLHAARVDRNDDYLLQYLNIFKLYEATNPRDKVYGLLGILHARFGLDTSTFGVDYEKSIAEVYTDAAVRVLRRGQDLELLNHIWHDAGHGFNTEFPSWVPRWDFKVSDIIVPRDVSIIYRHNGLLGRNKRLKILNIEEKRLLVNGFKYGSVSWISDIMAVGVNEEQATQQDGPYLRLFLRFWNEARKTRSSCLDKIDNLFASTLTFTSGNFGEGENADEPLGKQLIADYLDYVHKIMCVVEDGTMGTAPEVVEEGDQVVGFYGASSPIALRSTEDGYIVLGPVYVRRYMDGAMFQGMQKDGMEPERFTLI